MSFLPDKAAFFFCSRAAKAGPHGSAESPRMWLLVRRLGWALSFDPWLKRKSDFPAQWVTGRQKKGLGSGESRAVTKAKGIVRGREKTTTQGRGKMAPHILILPTLSHFFLGNCRLKSFSQWETKGWDFSVVSRGLLQEAVYQREKEIDSRTSGGTMAVTWHN